MSSCSALFYYGSLEHQIEKWIIVIASHITRNNYGKTVRPHNQPIDPDAHIAHDFYVLFKWESMAWQYNMHMICKVEVCFKTVGCAFMGVRIRQCNVIENSFLKSEPPDDKESCCIQQQLLKWPVKVWSI